MAGAPDELSQLALFAAGPVVLFKWRNSEGWPVEWVSPNVLAVFGRPAEQFVNGDVGYAELLHPEDLDRVAAEVTTALEDDAVSFEHAAYRIQHIDGTYRWLQDITHLHRTNGEVTHFVGYVVDVTERLEATRRRHAMELKLLHGQKMESLGVLAGGVAHDFNNLLTGILGEANLASMAIDEDVQDVRDSIRQIETLARRAADLTRQLLAYSGKGRFIVEPVDVTDLLQEISQMLKLAISKKAALELHLAEDLPAIDADRGQLQQVAMNLLTNASEALGDATGVIRVTTRVEDCTSQSLTTDYQAPELSEGRYVVLEVSDTGCGMNNEVRERLFEPFFTTKEHGRGLGMSAILGIMRAHRGAIRVYSEPGQGTAFKLLFPASAHVAAENAPARPHGKWQGSGVALVVDDEDSVRNVAERLLQRLGFETITAADGAQALERFKMHRERVRLVVLDMMMPVLSGRETLSALRRMEPDLPIVVASGFNEQETISRLAARGLTSFLQKPFQAAELEDAVRRALE